MLFWWRAFCSSYFHFIHLHFLPSSSTSISYILLPPPPLTPLNPQVPQPVQPGQESNVPVLFLIDGASMSTIMVGALAISPHQTRWQVACPGQHVILLILQEGFQQVLGLVHGWSLR